MATYLIRCKGSLQQMDTGRISPNAKNKKVDRICIIGSYSELCEDALKYY